MVKIGYKKIQTKGEWFIWYDRKEKLKKKGEEEKTNRRKKVQRESEQKGRWTKKTETGKEVTR
jgi:hypothetical protein